MALPLKVKCVDLLNANEQDNSSIYISIQNTIKYYKFIKDFRNLSVFNIMVDGADKINNINNNIYFNPQDATIVYRTEDKEPIPLVEKGNEYKYPFAVELESDSIEFNIPEGATQNAKEFIEALIKNKKALMKNLNIDSDTYDILAQTAVGIANAETDFGSMKNRIYKAYRELYIRSERIMYNFIDKKPRDYSRGMTNLKYTLHTNDPRHTDIKEQMAAFKIFYEYQLENPENSAIGTIIVLANFNKRIDKEYAEGFKQSQEKYGITKTDALCAMWNGAYSRSLVKGEFNPKEWAYTDKVHKTLEQYCLIKKQTEVSAD